MENDIITVEAGVEMPPAMTVMCWAKSTTPPRVLDPSWPAPATVLSKEDHLRGCRVVVRLYRNGKLVYHPIVLGDCGPEVPFWIGCKFNEHKDCVEIVKHMC